MSGSAPVTGTVPGTGAMGRAYGLMLRWWRMVANQPTRCTTSSGLQPRTERAARAARAIRAAKAAGAAGDLGTSHLFCPRAAQQRLDLARPRGLARDEDAEVVIREARLVGHGPQGPRGEQGVEADPEDGGERTEQHRHLEHDDDVRGDGADGLAADHDGPVVRHVQREPGADGTARNAADQREHADGADGLVERVLQLVARHGRVHGEVGVAGRAQSADRVDGCVQVAEHRQQARRGRRAEDGGGRIDQLHAATALPRLGAGSTSFTSEIDTAGKFFTNSRNHMKNQPKLPAMMPQSAHVGLYVALANRSNGSPASDTTMITKRSNHIPMFTKIDTTNNAVTLVRTFLDHNSHGNSPLQMFIVQLAHQNGPNARYQKAARSCGLPPNQAVKFSVQYGMLTIMPVSRHSFARFSK